MLPLCDLYELFVLGINMPSLFWVNFTIFWLLCVLIEMKGPLTHSSVPPSL